jgi:hypothetical protein
MLSAFACSSDRPPLHTDLPPMPASVRVPCKHPLIGETDARGIIARYAVALTKCDAKRADAVSLNDDLRKGPKP